MEWYLWLILICIILWCTGAASHVVLHRIIRRRMLQKGRIQGMTSELVREFIGQNCYISMFNGLGAYKGLILSVDDRWIKLQEKKNVRMINLDWVTDIRPIA